MLDARTAVQPKVDPAIIMIEAMAEALMADDRERALRLLPAQTSERLRAEVAAAPRDEALTLAYQGSLSKERRRKGGVHYTPLSIAQRLLEPALELLQPASAPSVLDPAMGGGAFLRAALRLCGGTSARARREFARRLYGIELDEAAVLLARRALWLAVGDAQLAKESFDGQLVQADAMLSKGAQAELVATRWSALFHRIETPRSFDLVVMNPPFLGGKRLRTVHGEQYAAALQRATPGTNGNTDLAAHFLRRGYEVLRDGGVLAAVTTNTIAQGDTREGGLQALIERGATIARAETRVPWPGEAGVVTSLLWVTRGACALPAQLDGQTVASIDTFLSSHAHERPPLHATMQQRAFIGCFLRGKGFVFDDVKGQLPSQLRATISQRPESARRIKPFLGGEEVVKSPSFAAHRHVIDFSGDTLKQAEADPELVELLRNRVKPFRDGLQATPADRAHRLSWWRFANHRPNLRRAIEGLEHVLVMPRVSSQVVAVRLPNRYVYSDQLVVVASASFAVFAWLNSRLHAEWARLHSSTLGDGLRYTPSDVFETLPPPLGSFPALEADAELAAQGLALEQARNAILSERRIGLSALMRKVCEPPLDAQLSALRDQLVALDQAVFKAYGYSDLEPEWHAERGHPAFKPALRAELLQRLKAIKTHPEPKAAS